MGDCVCGGPGRLGVLDWWAWDKRKRWCSLFVVVSFHLSVALLLVSCYTNILICFTSAQKWLAQRWGGGVHTTMVFGGKTCSIRKRRAAMYESRWWSVVEEDGADRKARHVGWGSSVGYHRR